MNMREAYFNRKRIAIEALRLREVEHLNLREIGLRLQPLTVRGGHGKERARQLLAFGVRLRKAGFIPSGVVTEGSPSGQDQPKC